MDLAVGISQHTIGKKKTLPSNTIDYVLQMSFEQIKQTSKQKKTSLRKELYKSRIWHLHERRTRQEECEVTVERAQCQH